MKSPFERAEDHKYGLFVVVCVCFFLFKFFPGRPVAGVEKGLP